jgi:predicted Zn-dependent protease
MDFFEENAVKISAAGMGAIKAMLSEYNAIDKIVVNGGASSKPTSRAGGNEQLAKDRRAAGMKALEDLKKSVPQLKNAQIVEGTAKVQSEAEESDPKMQQVSFMVSGSSKASEIVNSEAVTITTIDKKMGDQVRLWKNEMIVAINGLSPEK